MDSIKLIEGAQQEHVHKTFESNNGEVTVGMSKLNSGKLLSKYS